MLKDFGFIPLTLWFHPALVAATFLAWTRQHLIDQQPPNTKPELPEMLYGNAWYLYVDSGINQSELEHLKETLADEFKFIIELLNPPQTTQNETNPSQRCSSGHTTQAKTTPEQPKPTFY